MRVHQVLSPAPRLFASGWSIATLLVLLTLPSASVWSSEFPNQPIYQGTLQDGQGSPLQGYHDLEFRFYTAAEGGQMFAVVSFGSVEIRDGKFTVAFEDGRAEPDLPWTDPGEEETQIFLSIAVDGLPETPRLAVSTDRQAVFALPDDGDGTSSLDAVSPAAVPTVVGEPFLGAGGDEGTVGTEAGSNLGNQEPPRSVTLAKLTLDNGNTVEFVALPELGDVGVIEIAAIEGDGSTIAAYQDSSALEIFRRVAPEETPIPPLLLELEAARHQDPGEDSGLDADLLLPPEPAEEASGPADLPEDRALVKSHCGADGAEDFKDDYCDQSGLNLFSPIKFCDHNYPPAGGNSVWYSLIRNSIKNGNWEKRWNSHGITGTCSTDVKVFHFYWGYTAFVGMHWKLNFSFTVAPGQVTTTLWFGGSKRYRRVERYRLGAVGGFRAATTFYNNV